jgi:cytoskeletal protein CcmA (bactofilin family)
MFFFRKKKSEEKYPFGIIRASLPEGTSYLGKNLDVAGTVSGDGDIIIMGPVNGIFDMTGEINIGGTSKICGELKSNSISVNGFIEGTLVAYRNIHLDATASVKGIIAAPILSIVEGALFDGEVRMSNNAEGLIFENSGGDGNERPVKNRLIKKTGDYDILFESASLISRNSKIDGDITGHEDIIVEGLIKGSVKIDGSIIVGSSGVIEADIEAYNISVQGNITGNVSAKGQIEIQPSGSISGDISAGSIDVREGASFEGRSRMMNINASEFSAYNGGGGGRIKKR